MSTKNTHEYNQAECATCGHSRLMHENYTDACLNAILEPGATINDDALCCECKSFTPREDGRLAPIDDKDNLAPCERCPDPCAPQFCPLGGKWREHDKNEATGCTCGSTDDHHTSECYSGQENLPNPPAPPKLPLNFVTLEEFIVKALNLRPDAKGMEAIRIMDEGQAIRLVNVSDANVVRVAKLPVFANEQAITSNNIVLDIETFIRHEFPKLARAAQLQDFTDKLYMFLGNRGWGQQDIGTAVNQAVSLYSKIQSEDVTQQVQKAAEEDIAAKVMRTIGMPVEPKPIDHIENNKRLLEEADKEFQVNSRVEVPTNKGRIKARILKVVNHPRFGRQYHLISDFGNKFKVSLSEIETPTIEPTEEEKLNEHLPMLHVYQDLSANPLIPLFSSRYVKECLDFAHTVQPVENYSVWILDSKTDCHAYIDDNGEEVVFDGPIDMDSVIKPKFSLGQDVLTIPSRSDGQSDKYSVLARVWWPYDPGIQEQPSSWGYQLYNDTLGQTCSEWFFEVDLTIERGAIESEQKEGAIVLEDRGPSAYPILSGCDPDECFLAPSFKCPACGEPCWVHYSSPEQQEIDFFQCGDGLDDKGGCVLAKQTCSIDLTEWYPEGYQAMQSSCGCWVYPLEQLARIPGSKYACKYHGGRTQRLFREVATGKPITRKRVTRCVSCGKQVGSNHTEGCIKLETSGKKVVASDCIKV